MNCMKCGRDIEDDQVFCQRCLETMAHYPVSSATFVQLPHRDTAPVKRSARKRFLTPEEQVAKLRKRTRRLWAVILVLTLLLVGYGAFSVSRLSKANFFDGRNYSVVPSTTPTTSE